MSSNDESKVPAEGDHKTTQPMIGEVFRLLEELKQSMETRFDAITARLDETNARLDETNARLDATNARLDETNARLDATNARLDVTNTRLDEIESRLARDIEGVNARLAELAEGQKELSYKMNALNRSRLQTEADYENLFDRIRELESKAS
jgi:chromosome segregation ATPase